MTSDPQYILWRLSRHNDILQVNSMFRQSLFYPCFSALFVLYYIIQIRQKAETEL